MNPMRTPPRNRLLDVRFRRLIALLCGAIAAGLLSQRGVAQTQTATTSTGFAPGSRELFSINFAQEPLGQIPPSLQVLSGTMEVVEKEGMRMLRASQRSEFLVTLPDRQRLPEKFTLEIDLFTRAAGYNNEELGFEGTPTLYQNSASARISWYQGRAMISGGRETDPPPVTMPEDIRALIEGDLAEIRATFDGDNFRLYTNGRELFNLPDLKFVRGRVLRVALGGNDPDRYAVHLAKLRIADATTTSTVATQQQSALASPGTRGSSTATPPAITGLTVSLDANGAAVARWNPLPVPAEYFVVRWNVNDPTCCNAMSPPGTPLTSTMWQDIILPVRGTYAYRLIAKTANGTVEATTLFTYGAAAPTSPSQPTDTTSIATGLPRTGEILAPDPTAPYSSTPRTVSLISDTTTTTTTPTTSTTTTIPASTTTNPTLDTTTTTTTGTTTTEPVTAVMATTTGTGMLSTPIATTSTSGPGMPASPTPRYRVLLTGFAVVKLTNDDPLSIDGKGDEAFGAAAVVNWNRQTNQMTSYSFVQTRDYGDVAVRNLFPDRIQAGTFSGTGGLAVGNRVPASYDVTGTNIPAPGTDQFPLLVWEGELTAGVDSVVIAPSLWERDTIRAHFDNYKSNWSRVSASALMGTRAVAGQYTTTTVTSALVAMDPLTAAAPPAPTFSQPPSSSYKIAALAFGPSSDRPIGMSAAPGVLTYQERVVLITREKLYALNPGDGITIALPLAEPLDILLNGMYTLYLRVQRTQ